MLENTDFLVALSAEFVVVPVGVAHVLVFVVLFAALVITVLVPFSVDLVLPFSDDPSLSLSLLFDRCLVCVMLFAYNMNVNNLIMEANILYLFLLSIFKI